MPAKGRTSLPPDLHQRLLAAFREHPGDHTAVRRIIGVDARTARRGWERGWPGRNWPAIKPIVEREQEERRARLAGRAPAMLADAELQAEREVMLARGSGVMALELLSVTRKLMPRMKMLAEQIEQTKDLAPDPVGAMAVLGRFTRSVGRAVEVARAAIELERIRVGDPQRIELTVQHEQVDAAAVAAEARALLADLAEVQSEDGANGAPQLGDSAASAKLQPGSA